MAMHEFTVYLDDELHERLSVEQEHSGLRKAEIVRAALRAAFNDERFIPYKAPKATNRQGRMSAAREHVKELLEKTPATTRPGRRWQRCPFLFKSAHGKYHCLEKKKVFPKCLFGCKAYYQGPMRKKGK